MRGSVWETTRVPTEQVLLCRILNSTQQTSSSALAYDEIAKIIDEAQNISEAALATSNEAHDNVCSI